MSAELRQLKPGNYTASLTVDDRPVKHFVEVLNIEQGHFPRLSFTLPSQKLLVLRLTPLAQ